MSVEQKSIKETVTARYGGIAERLLSQGSQGLTLELTPMQADASCCGPSASGSSCCGEDTTTDVSQALNLYSPAEIRDLPPEVVGATLGCGNPMAIASLKAGETVLDLGSGAGLDCFLAARQVGPTGHVIGLDMTDNMLELARRNQVKVGLANVEFRKGEIERMPLADSSVDVIISNCVINLSADKDAVFSEAFRVLKPGGRFAVSDIVTHGEVPAEFRTTLELWAGCLAGALDDQDYQSRLRAAGFTEVQITGSSALRYDDIDEWASDATKADSCCAPSASAALARGVQGKIASAQIQATKAR